MKIHLPNSAFLGNIDSFLRSFDNTDPTRLEITSNEKWIAVHPVVLSMIGSLGLTVDPERIEFADLLAKSRAYVERMGLYRLLGIESPIDIVEHEAAGRFIPLQRISNPDELTKFLTNMIPLLHLSAEKAEPIRHIVSELVRNVLEHSSSPHGAVLAAQYYKKSNRIGIGIADAGMGIRTSITKSHIASDDLKAIQLALMPGITGTTSREGGTADNAGAGLFIIKAIARVNRDFFMIYSGNAMYKLLKAHGGSRMPRINADPFADKHSRRGDLPNWNGTVVGIDLSLDATSEFVALLGAIRKIYFEEIKRRKRKRYREPRFE